MTEPIKKKHHKSVRDILRESAPYLSEEFNIDEITKVQDFGKLGDRVNQILVLSLNGMMDARAAKDAVKEIHQRLDFVDGELRKSHVCTQEELIDKMSELLDNSVQNGIRHELRLSTVEDWDKQQRDTRWKTIAIFAGWTIFFLSSMFAAIWWTARQSATIEDDHIEIDANTRAVDNIRNDIHIIRAAADQQKGAIGRHSERLTMLEDSTTAIRQDVWALKGSGRRRK